MPCRAVLCCVQVPGFALNKYIVIEQFEILDMGGSNVIHMFGRCCLVDVCIMTSVGMFARCLVDVRINISMCMLEGAVW